MLLTFYKEAEINLWSTNLNLLHKGDGHEAVSHQKACNSVLGALLVVCSCSVVSLQFIIRLQAKMIQNYPCFCSNTAIMITFGAIKATGFALSVEKDQSQWKLGWDFKLLTVSYTLPGSFLLEEKLLLGTYHGIFALGAMFAFKAWCVQMRDPLVASVFNPSMLGLVAVAGCLVLDEKLHLGTQKIATLLIVAVEASYSSSRSNILVAIPNDVSMAYNTFDDKEEQEDEKEEEQEDGNYDDKGKGDNSEATAKV
ncbi:hypothetical protein RHMOL_Rhmol11G0196600 [Rhododendron molle]|uniref:Uncharacterized protein n=1 Tax=Rhododendron molle TaxID=49168 RepID=A0ACC0LU40_RHOML|nr:hypothetical protein RHMOL_Rhmol11G0196600 [Rhododendron molle]